MGEYADRRENVLFVGNSETGKTHVASVSGFAGCMQGPKVRFATAKALVNQLMEMAEQRQSERTPKQLERQDILILDELGYVIEERFYAIAPPEARKAIDEAGVDIESVEDFVSTVSEPHADLCQQTISEIHRLHTSGKLPAVYHEDEAKEVEPLLKHWKKEGLKAKEVTKLMDMLYVTGRQLHDCAELPEWKGFVDQYQRHWFGEDERFRHVYAVLEDGPEVWLDKKGHHKGPAKPSEWITRRTELLLGLASHDEKATRSVQSVGAELRNRLDTAEQNIRLFLAIKAVLGAAADAVGLEVPGDEGVLAGPHRRLGAYIALYNIRVRKLREERALRESGETRSQKVLKMLLAIDVERLSPSPDSLK